MKEYTLKVQNINGRNFKRYKQMETYPMFTLEELILLNIREPQRYTYSIQPLSKFQWLFFIEIEKQV